jgi:hypothetical protein
MLHQLCPHPDKGCDAAGKKIPSFKLQHYLLHYKAVKTDGKRTSLRRMRRRSHGPTKALKMAAYLQGSRPVAWQVDKGTSMRRRRRGCS